jgi:transposase InsO family protein
VASQLPRRWEEHDQALFSPLSNNGNVYLASLRRFRAEFLDAEVFFNLADAQMKLSVYRRYYNEQRPHSALGYQPPLRAAQSSKTALKKNVLC